MVNNAHGRMPDFSSCPFQELDSFEKAFVKRVENFMKSNHRTWDRVSALEFDS